MAEASVTNPLVKQFRRGGVPRDIRLMAAQGLLPLKPEDLLELWTGLVVDSDVAVRGAADSSLRAFPAGELRSILARRETPVEVLSWVVGNRAEPELREAALQNHPRPDEVIEACAAAPEEPEPELATEGDLVMTEDEAIVRYLSQEDRQDPEKVRVVRSIYRLTTAERIITALKGSREERSILLRDPNRLVAIAVLGSPRITEVEIESISAMKDVSVEILRTIGNHREWTKRYTVLNNLVRNPRTPVGIAVGFSPEERELLMRLSGLFVKVNRSFGALGDRLTGEQREEIEATLERARTALREGILSVLRACVEETQRASRLLEEWSEASQSSSATHRTAASERTPGPSESSTDTPWSARTVVAGTPVQRQPAGPPAGPQLSGQPSSPSAVELYDGLVRARLSKGRCDACGASLAAALLVRTDTHVGPELNELGLSDEGAARYLAATDDLVVTCGQCGARNVVRS